MSVATKYKQYLSNPNVPLPKTTSWRFARKRHLPDDDTSSTTISTGKRKGYNRDNKMPIPRQTLWFWKKKGMYIHVYICMYVCVIVTCCPPLLIRSFA